MARISTPTDGRAVPFDPQAQTRATMAGLPRHFRLVDRNGAPHPVLDDHYDSMEAAWNEARSWWQGQEKGRELPIEIGVEVSTGCGSWRTLRHPGSELVGPV